MSRAPEPHTHAPGGSHAGTWTGTWVADRLGIAVRTTDAPLGVALDDLVGLAVRRNPRRAHLLVSTVLGKHVPTDPRLVYGSGLLLGGLVARALVADAGAEHPRDQVRGELLRLALAGAPGASEALMNHARSGLGELPDDTVVLGYAETATALGHAVADALDVPMLHSTRRPVAAVAAVGGFEEEHSHATSHLLLPDNPQFLAGAGPLVLVDDELSTGTTALNTIAALHAVHPREHYVIAALVDLRSDTDRERMAAVAAELGARIDMVALAAGRVDLPTDVLVAGQRLVEETEATQTGGGSGAPHTGARRVHRVAVPVAAGLREGGRHGFTPDDRTALEDYLETVAERVLGVVDSDRSVHVLGFEELMYAPLRLATSLAERLPHAPVTYSTTTRSPVLAVADDGYAIRSRLVFPAHDNPADGPGDRFAYNVAPTTTTDGQFDTVVLVVDATAETLDLVGPTGLLTQLADVCGRVVVVVIPDYRPTPDSTTPTTPGETL